jgi:hypothetical protein
MALGRKKVAQQVVLIAAFGSYVIYVARDRFAYDHEVKAEMLEKKAQERAEAQRLADIRK